MENQAVSTYANAALNQAFIRQPAVLKDVLPVSASTLWRYVKAGKFPKPIKLSERVTAWRSEDIRAWIDAQGQV